MKRSLIIGTSGVAAASSLLALAASPIALTKLQEVGIANGVDRSVPTKAVGPTDVSGTEG